MKNTLFNFSLFLFLYCLSITSASAQNTKPSSTPPAENDSEVVKISTNLIQLDVIVTDKNGRQVTDLKPEDFEIYENGKKQDISNFSYILTGGANQTDKSSNTDKSNKKLDKNAIPAPPSKIQLEKIHRTYALVVDDLGLSFENVYWVQQNLKKFINEQMQEGDLVAIIRTGSGVGALQSFTNNKQQLLTVINKLKWNPQGRGGISSFEPIRTDFKDELAGTMKANGTTSKPVGGAEDKEFQDQIEEFRNENFSVGTIGALSYIIRGMRELPGRKSLMLVSEGFQLIKNNQPTRVFDAMKLLADQANRSSVVIYTIDPRGIQVPGMATAEDDIQEVIPDGYDAGKSIDPTANRESDFRDSQQSLRYLAYETGGLPYVNQNNMNVGLRRVMEDQNGYYLIGYQPDSDTFDPKKNKYNKLSVKMKREGLKVRYRSGFYGVTDKKLEEVERTPQQQIFAALTSPFGKNDITLSVNALFAENEKGGSFIRSFVNIDARDLNFNRETDGTYKATFDLVAMTFGDNGAPVDQVTKNYTIRLGEKNYQKILRKGFVYNLIVPIKKPGAYQFRIALRDSNSSKIGSASQYVDVPNLKKGNLTLSGIVLDSFSIDEWQKISHGQNLAVKDNDETEIDADASLRIFRRGAVIRYDYLIYNAQTNPTQLQVQVRLFKDGKLLIDGKPSVFDTAGQTDLKRLEAVGAITLGNNLAPGNYVLQIVVKDNLAKAKRQIAVGSVDFEIVE